MTAKAPSALDTKRADRGSTSSSDQSVQVFPFDRRWSLADAVELACVLEATAPKVGNVHPGAAFADMRYSDFLASAGAIAPVFKKSAELSVGELVLQSVVATRKHVGLNTNLGTVLLLAPIAKAAALQETRKSPSEPLIRGAVQQVLDDLTALDSQLVYEAIRVAKPGGIGNQAENDVQGAAPASLIEAMQQAASFDAVARQYANGFADIFVRLVPWLNESLAAGSDVFAATCSLQVRMLAEEPDGLIARKCGHTLAEEIQSLAQRVVQATEAANRNALLRDLDTFLRGDGHRRNPGTTADMIAATLFVRLLWAS